MSTNNLNLLALDLGASNGRAILGKYNGKTLNFEVLHKFKNGGIRVNGSDYWDILHLFQEIKNGLNKAVIETSDNIDSIGIDTWGVDYGLLDRRGDLLTNPYHYRDNRTNGLREDVFDNISKEKVYNETGIQFIWFNTLYQLFADTKFRPWILDNAETLLFTPDLLNYFLTGQKYNEYTIASTSQMFNPEHEDWSDPIFEKLNFPQDIVQEIIYPGEKVGNLLEEVKKECNIKQDIPVIAVGSHDTESAIAATPLTDRKRNVYISSGTWSLLGMELNSPFINEASLRENYTNECGVGKKIAFLKNLCGLWLIQECKRIWEKQGKNLSYDEIDEAAREAEANKFIIDPNDQRFQNPEDMPEAIREYCRETNQPQPENYGQMARGIYESLALSYKSAIETLQDLLDRNIDTINMVGGGIRAEILCQFTADITERRVVTGPVEATAMGNMLAQLMAAGEIKDLKEGRELIKNSVDLNEYIPED